LSKSEDINAYIVETCPMSIMRVSLRSILLCVLVAFASFAYAGDAAARSGQTPVPPKQFHVKPNRVLVIIGDQWTDPMSYNIDPKRVKGMDFLDVVTMLKIWGVPFDVLRLDEQRLQINRFLDGAAKPKYGCAIWMANPDSLRGFSADYHTLKRAVEEFGISMIALFDYIEADPVADLVGVACNGVEGIRLGQSKEKFAVEGNHFVTTNASGILLPDEKLTTGPSVPGGNGITPPQEESTRDTSLTTVVHCTARGTTSVLGRVGADPQLTVRDVTGDTKVIWIGGGKDWFRAYPVMRGIFRKSLVYAMGYGLFNDNFDNGFIFIMDDVGCSEHAWSLRWHYPTPTKETLMKYLIEPLQQRGKMMVFFLTSGFANPETKMIEVPWDRKPFTDIFGNVQDYRSTKEGLVEGLRRGVFEIQGHRAWSHMNWDLDSPPGPWWGSKIDGELAETDWYNEIVDVRRGYTPVPSNDLLFIYKSGIDAIRQSFGVTELAAEVRTGAEVRLDKPGGDDNGRVAAIAGLGVSRECYVGFDHTIEFSMMMPEQFTCHDLDLTAKTDSPADTTEAGWDSLLKLSTQQLLSSKIAGGRRMDLRSSLAWIDRRKDKHWMGFNETCAYLHSGIESTGKANLEITLRYDDHYCDYFKKRRSTWTLELSDQFLTTLGNGARINIDGRPVRQLPASKQLLEIPAGLGKHSIQILAHSM
jgi:hypothetical protein